MRAGNLRQFLEFKELQKVQRPSGSFQNEWVTVYKCRAEILKSSPIYDKDGVDAKEIFQGTNRFMKIRNTSRVNEKQRVVWKGSEYEILVINPQIDDNTLRLQLRQIDV